jgi:sugar/nucleoside kinase (ribokinase family)
MAKQVIVAGHICLDVIPPFESEELVHLFPGSLHHVGSPIMATGGAVANTGLAMHRLGFDTNLVAKIGKDAFGEEIVNCLERIDPTLSTGLIIDRSVDTSYSIVINPPGLDRIFLHCPGANDSFSNDDISDSKIESASLFHFGYPPLMKKFYENNGTELKLLFQRMKKKHMITSLDMALPDPASEPGQINWKTILKECLPFVDIFLPSLEELIYMLDPKAIKFFKDKDHSFIDQKMLSRMADKLLHLGAAIIVIKLGVSGLYVKTTKDKNRLMLSHIDGFSNNTTEWLDREFISPCFKVKEKGTTGAGDSTIAGFLGGIMKGLPPQQTATFACAVGAFCVEKEDATSNIPIWEEVIKRVSSGWSKVQPTVNLERFTCKEGMYFSQNDRLHI